MRMSDWSSDVCSSDLPKWAASSRRFPNDADEQRGEEEQRGEQNQGRAESVRHDAQRADHRGDDQPAQIACQIYQRKDGGSLRRSAEEPGRDAPENAGRRAYSSNSNGQSGKSEPWLGDQSRGEQASATDEKAADEMPATFLHTLRERRSEEHTPELQ